ncbi:MAG: SMC-Scp complex subunit ScpB [Elusimicrobiales bacterium]|nr:SMC-Scp complex subunit ScpB [Elusimicrobiales bacterium]
MTEEQNKNLVEEAQEPARQNTASSSVSVLEDMSVVPEIRAQKSAPAFPQTAADPQEAAAVNPAAEETPAKAADEAPAPQAAASEPAKEAPAAQEEDSASSSPSGDLLETDDLKKIIETLLFITDRPVKPGRIADVVETADARRVREIIRQLQEEYASQGRAVQIVELGGGFQMSTKPEYGRWVRRLYNEKMTTKLSNAALETLAIVAYKQPITRAEMEAIRGVDVAGPLERLLERALVRVVGKKDTVGRPMVYGTTDEFLRMFGLNKISELPDLQVFAAKTLHEKQEDLPFGEPLPPLSEPAIIPLEELEGEEKLEALDSSAADPFFTRNSYNRGDFFTPGTLEESAPAAGQDEASAHAQEEVIADNELAALQTARGEEKQQSETGAAAEERTNQEEN